LKPVIYKYNEPFQLENGKAISDLNIAYHTYGKLNADQSNVVWICHALTADSDVSSWWEGLVGPGKLFDPSQHFIVCANIIGSCYGSSGPDSKFNNIPNPQYSDFPGITIRDMVNAHIVLKNHLNINRISIAVGGSMGGYQVLEWSIMEPNTIEKQVLLCTSAKESAWGIAIHTAQRMAIENDHSWKDHDVEAGKNGLVTARAIGMLIYRGYDAFVNTQTDEDDILDNFKASSYVKYQGEKLADRFNVYSYWLLTKAMDSHNLSRDRGSLEQTLEQVKSKTLVIGIKSDILCPINEQYFIAENIHNAELEIIDSLYGHDGFLIEFDQISPIIEKFISN